MTSEPIEPLNDSSCEEHGFAPWFNCPECAGRRYEPDSGLTDIGDSVEPLFDSIGWVHRPDGSLATDEDGEPTTVEVQWKRRDA